MNPTSDVKDALLIAIPCYGSRVLPRFGQAREFVFAEVDPGDGVPRRLRRCNWDVCQEPQLARWLRREGIEAVLCGGIHPRFQLALGAEGIRVAWGFRGEVEEVLRQWLNERGPAKENCADPVVAQTVCPSRRMVRKGCPHRDKGETS